MKLITISLIIISLIISCGKKNDVPVKKRNKKKGILTIEKTENDVLKFRYKQEEIIDLIAIRIKEINTGTSIGK